MGTIPRYSENSVFFYVFSIFLCQIELSLQSGTDLIFQKWSERLSFVEFWSADRALATVSSTFCRPHLPRVLQECKFFKLTFWSANCALATVLRTFVDNFARSRRNRRPTLATPRTTLPEKTQGFAPESDFTFEFTRSRTVTLLYCSHTRTAFAHYLVDMVMAWWQDWPWTYVRSSEVFELNFLW